MSLALGKAMRKRPLLRCWLMVCLASLLGACGSGSATSGESDSEVGGPDPLDEGTPSSPETPTAPGTPNDPGTPISEITRPPAGKLKWDWQIGASSDSNIIAPAGAKLMDVDLFTASTAKVSALKQAGAYTVCYLNAGSWQPGLPDSGQYPAALKIQKDPDWPEEWFLDVRDVFKPDSALATILRNRLALCKSKGFQAVEPDNLQNDENVKGGIITTQNQIDFNGWFADEAHKAGLAVFQKNGPDKVLLKDRTGKMMVEKFDGILNEECQQYNECAPLAEYVKRGKLALNVEYSSKLNCTTSDKLNINSIQKDLGLTGANMSGYKYGYCP